MLDAALALTDALCRHDTLVSPGTVHQLGRHRLMCGDAGNPEHVAALFAGAKPDLVFTSPPYAQQRVYGGISDWDLLMQRTFTALPCHDKTQILVNLGLVHRQAEVWQYWSGWVEWMRQTGWRYFGQYVWDKLDGMPGNWNGRLSSSFEMLFHFNRQAVYPNKTVPCKSIGRTHSGHALRNGKFGAQTHGHVGTSVNTHKIADATFRIPPEKANRTGHPAVFPVALPAAVHAAYSPPGGIVYDPFVGSGTSILAAEQQGRVCYAMEIHPPYAAMALQRWERYRA